MYHVCDGTRLPDASYPVQRQRGVGKTPTKKHTVILPRLRRHDASVLLTICRSAKVVADTLS